LKHLLTNTCVQVQTFETFQDVEQYKMEQLIEAGLNETEKSALERAEVSSAKAGHLACCVRGLLPH
jgi:hypothetical protein